MDVFLKIIGEKDLVATSKLDAGFDCEYVFTDSFDFTPGYHLAEVLFSVKIEDDASTIFMEEDYILITMEFPERFWGMQIFQFSVSLNGVTCFLL